MRIKAPFRVKVSRTGVIASAEIEPVFDHDANDTGRVAWRIHDDSIHFKFMRKDGSYK